MNNKTTLPKERIARDFPQLAEAMAAHCITTTVPDEPNGQPLEIWVMPIGLVCEWMQIAVKEALASSQKDKEEAYQSGVKAERNKIRELLSDEVDNMENNVSFYLKLKEAINE